MMALHVSDVVLKKSCSSFNPENPAADNIRTSKNIFHEMDMRL